MTTIPEVQLALERVIDAEFAGKLSSHSPQAWHNYGLCRVVERQNLKEVMRQLRDDNRFLFNMLIDVTAVDWMDLREPRFEVVYQLLSITFNHRLMLKAYVPEQDPVIDSVRDLWPAANFLEREVWDMFGISFSGHGDLRRILMYDEFEGHPLRKDYPKKGKQPRVALRIPELRNTSADMKREDLVALPTRGQK